MTAEYTIDAQRELVVATWSGRFTLADIESAIMKMRRLPAFREEYHRLYDLRGMEVPDVSPAITSWVKFIDPFHPDTRRAVVATNLIMQASVRLFATFSGFDLERFRIFSEMEEATHWVLASTAAVS